jgi:hypothetical protein
VLFSTNNENDPTEPATLTAFLVMTLCPFLHEQHDECLEDDNRLDKRRVEQEATSDPLNTKEEMQKPQIKLRRTIGLHMLSFGRRRLGAKR